MCITRHVPNRNKTEIKVESSLARSGVRSGMCNTPTRNICFTNEQLRLFYVWDYYITKHTWPDSSFITVIKWCEVITCLMTVSRHFTMPWSRSRSGRYCISWTDIHTDNVRGLVGSSCLGVLWGWFMPKNMNICLHLSKLRPKYCPSVFFGHGIHVRWQNMNRQTARQKCLSKLVAYDVIYTTHIPQ